MVSRQDRRAPAQRPSDAATAIATDGGRFDGLMDAARARHQNGDFKSALVLCRQALADRPRHPDALYLAAVCARGSGALGQALELIAEADRAAPDTPAILSLEAAILAGTGDLAGALSAYDRALAVALAVAPAGSTEAAEIGFGRANALRLAGRTEDAEAGYRRLIDALPHLAPAHINLGALLLVTGRAGEAMPVLREATRLAPDQALAWANLAAAHLLRGAVDDCIAAARRALALDAGTAAAHVVLAHAHTIRKQRTEARACLESALALEPDNREALVALAGLHDADDDFDRAIDGFKRALEIAPDDPCTAGGLWFLLQRSGRWAEAAAQSAALDRLAFAQTNTPAEPAFVSISRTPDSRRNLEVAAAWARMIEAKMAGADAPGASAKPKERLRIGYLSYDFRDHAVGHLVRSLFSQHDRRDFDVLAFSYGPNDGSVYRRHIVETCDRFVDVAALGHAEAAAAIRAEAVDILVELTGHTKSSRLEICALRPAPLQATWLGFPGTTGARFIDYILTDAVLTPESEVAYYSEAPVILPDSYQVNDRWQEIAADAGGRAAHGLPRDGVVFASLVNSYKIEPVMFECWMQLLKRVPGSVLWLLSKHEGFKVRLREAAARQGVDPDRLVFAGFMAKADHLARLALADLGLDTRIYNGHTTTSDCLFAGLPVVTVKGRHFASRVSESLLRAIDLPQLVAADIQGYQNLAAALARDPERLGALRADLAAKRLTTPLFDTARTARHPERAYRAMWERAAAGAPPAPIRVGGLPRRGEGA